VPDSDLSTRNKLCKLKACISVNHRISLCDEERRHCEAKCLGGLKIDNQLELGGLLNRQVGGFGALEDLSEVIDLSLRPLRRPDLTPFRSSLRLVRCDAAIT